MIGTKLSFWRERKYCHILLTAVVRGLYLNKGSGKCCTPQEGQFGIPVNSAVWSVKRNQGSSPADKECKPIRCDFGRTVQEVGEIISKRVFRLMYWPRVLSEYIMNEISTWHSIFRNKIVLGNICVASCWSSFLTLPNPLLATKQAHHALFSKIHGRVKRIVPQ